MLILFGLILRPNPSLRTTRKTLPLPQRDDGQRRLICAAGARGRRHWCAATRARSRHDRGGVRGRLTRCRRSRRRSAARTDSRPTAVDKRVLSSTARDTVITFVVLEHHVVACTSPPSGRTSNGRSLRCRRTVDVNQYTVRASPRGFGALGGQRRAALVGCVSGLDGRCSGGLRTCFSALFVHYSSHHWGLGHEDPPFTPPFSRGAARGSRCVLHASKSGGEGPACDRHRRRRQGARPLRPGFGVVNEKRTCTTPGS